MSPDSDFSRRLERALSRGRQADRERQDAQAAAAAAAAALAKTRRDYARRLEAFIAERLEAFGRAVPGFQRQRVINEQGQGYAVARDDLAVDRAGQVGRLLSRLELLVLKAGETPHLKAAARPVVRNKDKAHRTEAIRLPEENLSILEEFIDREILLFAEDFADDDETAPPDK